MENRGKSFQKQDFSQDDHDEANSMPSFTPIDEQSPGKPEKNQGKKKYASAEEVAKTLEGIHKFMREAEKELEEIDGMWKSILPLMQNSNQTLESEPSAWEIQAEIDWRSVYVGNVDYSVTTEELEAVFQDCGAIKRSTIPYNPHSKVPKGFAYIEFEERVAAELALYKHSFLLKNREIEVLPKRTNIPGYNANGPICQNCLAKNYPNSYQ